MPTPEEQYDDAMFDFTRADYTSAIAKLAALLREHPSHFDAQLALGMAYYRLGEFATAIIEGHKAERLKPNEPLVHTNLSLFYMKSGDKKTAEHHGLQARISSWKDNLSAPSTGSGQAPSPHQDSEADLKFVASKPASVKVQSPAKMPAMPWKQSPTGPTAKPPAERTGDE